MSLLLIRENRERTLAMYTLTKMDVAALRAADTLCVHLTKDRPGLVRAIKRANVTERNPFAQDAEHIIPAEVGFVQYGTAHKALVESGTARCNGHVDFYHSQGTPT